MGGVQPYFLLKLVFEIGIAQQTKTSDQTFEGDLDHNRPPVQAVQPRLYLVKCSPNYGKSTKPAKKQYL